MRKRKGQLQTCGGANLPHDPNLWRLRKSAHRRQITEKPEYMQKDAAGQATLLDAWLLESSLKREWGESVCIAQFVQLLLPLP